MHTGANELFKLIIIFSVKEVGCILDSIRSIENIYLILIAF